MARDRSVWEVLFAVNVVLLVLLALSAPFVERGTPAFVVSVLALGFILVSLAGLALVIRMDWDPF